jgi:hypothetical protein
MADTNLASSLVLLIAHRPSPHRGRVTAKPEGEILVARPSNQLR